MSDEYTKKEHEIEKALNRKKTRENLIREILDTENNYISDLKFCVDIFLNPYDANKFESEGVEIGQLFLNFEKIYEISEKLLKLLNKYVKGFDFDQQTVGQCFLEVTKDLENEYSYYCVNIQSAIEYGSTVSQYPLISVKVNQLNEHYQDTTKLADLNSMLMKPVQRITKYPLLLDSLLEATEVDHIDYKGLVQANSCIKKVTNNVNESKRTDEVVTKYRRPTDVSLINKITNISSHSVQKKITRFKGFFASKTGLTPTIIDEEFSLKLQKLNSVQKTVSELKENLEIYLQEFEKSTTIFYELVNHVIDLYGDEARNSAFVLHLLELNKSSCAVGQSVAEHITTFLVSPLTNLIKLYEGPQALINKREDKLMEIYGNETLELAKKEYEALNYQLIKDLPNLCKMSEEIVLDIIIDFILLKNNYQKLWFSDVKKFIEFIEMTIEKNKKESSNQQVLERLYQLRFHQFFDASYPVQILACVLLDVPVLNALSSQPRGYSVSIKQCPRTYIREESKMRGFHSRSDVFPLSSNAKLKQSLMNDEDDGFYFAKIPYYARANQPEVSLDDGQFVTVTAKKDGSGNTEWWEVNTGDKVGYCPAICLEKATDFMETGEIPFSEFTIMDIS